MWRSQATRQPRTKPGTLGNQAQTHSLTSHRAERYSLFSLSLQTTPPVLTHQPSLLLSTLLLQFSPLDHRFSSRLSLPPILFVLTHATPLDFPYVFSSFIHIHLIVLYYSLSLTLLQHRPVNCLRQLPDAPHW